MALGNVNFGDLLKRTQGAMAGAGAGAAGAAGAQAAQNLPNNIAGADKADNKQNVDVTKMSTSDLMKHVYGNKAGENQQAQGENKENDNNKNKEVILPAVVEYNNEKFPANGQKLDKVVDEIVNKTGDSKEKVESELKKKYANPAMAKGMKLDMNA